MKPMPRLDGQTFEHLASQTRLGANAREMARLTLVEGETMHAVAVRLGTIPQRVRLAVGSIHRIQAALAWDTTAVRAAPVPERLATPLRNLISDIQTLALEPVDEQLMTDLQILLRRARQRIGARHRPMR